MTRVYVAGVGMTPFGRFLDRSVKDLAVQAAIEAMRDAHCPPERIGAAFFSNAAQGAVDGQHSIRGEFALLDLPFGNIPIINIENAGGHSVFMDVYQAFVKFHMKTCGTTPRQIAAVSHVAAKRAYEQAGIAPADISVAAVHDATAMGEIQQTENLMLYEFGGGGPLAESGATAIGGRIPVNRSGGLECRGHPIGTTGLAQVHELVTQLRGEAGARQVANARIAVAENGGSLIGVESAAVCVTVLGR